MIDYAQHVPTRSELSCDVCVVGAGAAGVVLAIELAKQGRSVILLEAGSKNRAGRSLELYRGELVSGAQHLPLDADRYRQLGGTSSLWGGRCIPFDPIDFEHRGYVSFSGWPIARHELDPFYRRAHVYCECGDFDYSASSALRKHQMGLVEGFVDGDVSSDSLERWSTPTHFGKRYRDKLVAAPGLRVLLNAVVHNLDFDRDQKRVTAAQVSTFSGNRFKVLAGTFVLSGGGLEATRLLLTANRESSDIMCRGGDWLGKGYMCHSIGVLAKVRFNPGVAVRFGFETDANGVYCRRRFWVPPEAQRKHKLLNSFLLLDRPLLGDADHQSGLFSLAFMAKTLVGKPDPDAKLTGGKYGLYRRHIRNILTGAPEILSVLPKWSRSRFLDGRRIPTLLSKGQGNVYHICSQSEQVPNKHSKVELSDERDRFGTPRLRVDFRFSDQDVDSVWRTHQLLGKVLSEQKLGQLEFLGKVEDASQRMKATLGHHIGTTRMAISPDKGVVDPNCRVFGTSNLFLASSSVFPTSSQANPTLTLVAMSLRLADHLMGAVSFARSIRN